MIPHQRRKIVRCTSGWTPLNFLIVSIVSAVWSNAIWVWGNGAATLNSMVLHENKDHGWSHCRKYNGQKCSMIARLALGSEYEVRNRWITVFCRWRELSADSTKFPEPRFSVSVLVIKRSVLENTYERSRWHPARWTWSDATGKMDKLTLLQVSVCRFSSMLEVALGVFSH